METDVRNTIDRMLKDPLLIQTIRMDIGRTPIELLYAVLFGDIGRMASAFYSYTSSATQAYEKFGTIMAVAFRLPRPLLDLDAIPRTNLADVIAYGLRSIHADPVPILAKTNLSVLEAVDRAAVLEHPFPDWAREVHEVIPMSVSSGGLFFIADLVRMFLCGTPSVTMCAIAQEEWRPLGYEVFSA